jgi:hypothetical protein
MKKTTVFMLACCFFMSAFIIESTAQMRMKDSTTFTEGPIKTRMFVISPGYAFIDVAAFDQFLAPSANAGFNQNFGTLALQYTAECRRFMYGWTIQMGMSPKRTIRDYAGVPGQNIEYYGTFGNILLQSGYSIVSTDRVKFYPILGVGFGGVNGNYNRVDNRTIAQFANNPNTEGTITKYMACFDGALSLDFLIPSRRYGDGVPSYGKVIGLRVGYTQGVGVGNWNFKGARVLENPNYNPGMVYAKIELGLFSRKSRTDDYYDGYKR